MDIVSILNGIITSGIGMSLVGGAFVLWWLSGRIPNLFSESKWSWKRGLEDLCKALLMGTLVVGGTGLLEAGSQYFALLGWDITDLVSNFNTFALTGAMAAGFAYYMVKALKNGWKFLTLKPNKGEGDLEQFEKGKAEIGENVREFIDTITTKTDKKHLKESGEAAPELFEDVEISIKDAGKGGVNNTYPDPYRSAVQDSMVDPSTCYNRECVSYCAWKIKELTGSWPRRTGSMNAKYWVERLAQNGYGTVVDKPQDGGYYVGVSTAGEYGHVVWFEGGQTISEYNYLSRGGFSVRVINLAAYKWVQIKAPATPAPAVVAPAVPENTPTKKDPSVTYTYKPGDTFGQVIIDLGLNTSHGLWGDNGDVAYYTKQLHDQGIWGNIPVGTTIKLTPRK